MESTEPLTLDEITEYEEAETGDCIVEVPEVRFIVRPRYVMSLKVRKKSTGMFD